MTSTQQPSRFHSIEKNTSFEEPPDFSLALGGPLFQLLRKFHLQGNGLELLHRRTIAIALFAWLPLMILAVLSSAKDQLGFDSFVRDVEVHTRLLIALPVLVVAELFVHLRIPSVIHRFVEQRLVTSNDLPGFRRAIDSAVALRNSVALEASLVVLVYIAGLWVWQSRVVLGATWYHLAGGHWNLTPAGYWYVFVSRPVFQFILLRWYLRLFIWFRFLWQASRLNLQLIPTHPDRCAGLAFIGKSAYAFLPIFFAQGVVLAGLLASRIMYRGESLISFKFQIGGFVVLFVFAVLAPLVMFSPRMIRTRRQGLAKYGFLAQRYVEGFERKWVRNTDPPEELLGSADIQSLADLGNSYDIIREMRPVPFGLQEISRLAIAMAAPFAPLLLTVFSVEELFMRVLNVVF
jgi:hypothetical protein